MAKKITKKIQEKYLDNPNCCPFCGSVDITGDHFEAEDSSAWRKVECNDCGEQWREVFELKFIENDEE